jgi:hypothetical protein
MGDQTRRPATRWPFLLLSREAIVENYYEYLRAFSTELGSRIVEMYPPLQGPKDPIAPALKTLLRKLCPRRP